MKTTLKDIANDTGYSVSTVSRVLNGSKKISSTTRKKVLKSAERYDYKTPKIRNANTSTQWLNVALVASGFHEGEFYTSFFNGLNQAARKNNIRLSLTGLSEPKEIMAMMKEISHNYYDAAIIYFPEFNRLQYQLLKDRVPAKFPIVSNALIENPLFSTITFDSYSGGHLAATHFEKNSHTKVGVIKGSQKRAESRFRYNGFADYINHHQKMELSWSYDGDYTFESGYEAFKNFEKLSEKPTAIFACNDDMCNGFMEAALESEISFPDDVAIMGYDNLPVCRHNRPTMSSIKTDYEALGSASMKLIREKLSDTELNSGILSFVPVSLVKRESSNK